MLSQQCLIFRVRLMQQKQLLLPQKAKSLGLVQPPPSQVIAAHLDKVPLLQPLKARSRIQISPSALLQFQKFGSKETALVSFIGSKTSGKSWLIDKVVQVQTEMKGNIFSREGSTSGTWMTSFFHQSQHSQVLLLDCQGLDQYDKHILVDYFKLLYSISSMLVLNLKSSQDLLKVRCLGLAQEAFQELTDSKLSFTPPALLLLYRDQAQYQPVHPILNSSWFSQTLEMRLPSPTKIADSEAIKNLSLNCFSEDLVRGVKQLQGLVCARSANQLEHVRMNSMMLAIHLQNTVLQLTNFHQLDLRKSWNKILEELYINSYNYSLLSFTQTLKDNLKQDKPLTKAELDDLLRLATFSAFQNYSSSGGQLGASQFQNKYRDKLASVIKEKCNQISEVNESKLNESRSKKLTESKKRLKQSKSPKDFIGALKEAIEINSLNPEFTRSHIIPAINDYEKSLVLPPPVKSDSGLQKKLEESEKRYQDQLNSKDRQIKRLQQEIKRLNLRAEAKPEVKAEVKPEPKLELKVQPKPGNQKQLRQIKELKEKLASQDKKLKELQNQQRGKGTCCFG